MSGAPQDPVGVTSRFLLDPYVDWAKGENIPIHQDFGLDLLALETRQPLQLHVENGLGLDL